LAAALSKGDVTPETYKTTNPKGDLADEEVITLVGQKK